MNTNHLHSVCSKRERDQILAHIRKCDRVDKHSIQCQSLRRQTLLRRSSIVSDGRIRVVHKIEATAPNGAAVSCSLRKPLELDDCISQVRKFPTRVAVRCKYKGKTISGYIKWTSHLTLGFELHTFTFVPKGANAHLVLAD